VQISAIATLRDLHYAIQVLFGWDGDHLHVFTVGKEAYSGTIGHLEETGYDSEVWLATALSSVKKIDYVYDLGAEWKHEITLVKTLPLDPERTYPVCVAFAGENPVEYPDEDDDYEDEDEDEDEEGEHFDIDEVNRRLAGNQPEGEGLF
jgi:hypothetical protein